MEYNWPSEDEIAEVLEWLRKGEKGTPAPHKVHTDHILTYLINRIDHQEKIIERLIGISAEFIDATLIYEQSKTGE